MSRLNTNIFPYFNDYSAAAKYYSVLFKPKVPVQAREVNAVQSIFQNQIESFGNHIFKEGAAVKDGTIQIENEYKYIRVLAPGGSLLESAVYREANFLNRVVVGDSGVKALVINHLPPAGGQVTFYVKYLGASTDGTISTFSNNEQITVLDADGNVTGTTATLAPASSTGIGSAANVKAGIFYIRGK